LAPSIGIGHGLQVGEIPLLVRRGGRDIKKMLRSLLNGADGVVIYGSCFCE